MGLQYLRIADPACPVVPVIVFSTAAGLCANAPHITKHLPLSAQLACFAPGRATDVLLGSDSWGMVLYLGATSLLPVATHRHALPHSGLTAVLPLRNPSQHLVQCSLYCNFWQERGSFSRQCAVSPPTMSCWCFPSSFQRPCVVC